MVLKMDNVGILKNSSVEISGLSVITGKNNSGKTTVGKVLYSLVRANSNVEDSFEQAKKAFLFSRLQRIRMLLYRFNLVAHLKIEIHNSKKTEEAFQTLLKLYNHDFPYNMLNQNVELALDYLIKLKETMQNIDFSTYLSYFAKEISDENYEKNIIMYQKYYSENANSIVELCEKTLHSIQDNDSFQQFIKDRTKTFLNYEFQNQINPVKSKRSVASIDVDDSGKKIISFKVHNKDDYEFESESSFSFSLSRAIFIDNPFVLDQVFESEKQVNYMINDMLEESNDSIGSFGVSPHNKYLIDLLKNRRSDNFFMNRELQLENKSVIKKINSIIPGEFQETDEGLFYIDNGAKLNVKNLATGSKMFSMIKMLLLNGYLDKGTVLVLDEPEAHLHPEWINKFAEIMALLIKEIGTKVLLTTHSPNLLLALDVYSKKYQLEDKSHFYCAQAETKSWKSFIKCIDGNTNEGYAHLSIPLIEMSIDKEGADKEC